MRRNNFKRGEKTLDFVKDKDWAKLSKIPVEQVKLDKSTLNKSQFEYDKYVSFKRFWTRPLEILYNLVGKKLSQRRDYVRVLTQKEIQRKIFKR